jgi:hypothetical protein
MNNIFYKITGYNLLTNPFYGTKIGQLHAVPTKLYIFSCIAGIKEGAV